jgi:hypothetical protein
MKIHFAVNAVDVLLQYLLDNTGAFYKIPPISLAQKAKAVNAVADGNLVGSLLLVFQLN